LLFLEVLIVDSKERYSIMAPSCTRSFLSTSKGRIPVKLISQEIKQYTQVGEEGNWSEKRGGKTLFLYAVTEDKAHAACIYKTRSWQPSIDICNSWLIND